MIGSIIRRDCSAFPSRGFLWLRSNWSSNLVELLAVEKEGKVDGAKLGIDSWWTTNSAAEWLCLKSMCATKKHKKHKRFC
jgi:hypothetical protein